MGAMERIESDFLYSWLSHGSSSLYWGSRTLEKRNLKNQDISISDTSKLRHCEARNFEKQKVLISSIAGINADRREE